MKSKSKILSLFVFLSMTFNCYAQIKDSTGYKLQYIVEGKDTIPVVNLPVVSITEFGKPGYMSDLKAYHRLRFNVIKVYPYAKLASIKINELNAHLATLSSDKQKKKYTKEFSAQLKKDFEDQIKNLSVNQGKVFIKLIDRETGHTSYELVKELRGSFNAFIVQTAAKLFGHDLKDDYDGAGNDKAIEAIVQQIESGEINQ
jgi:hypothetical protein